MKIYSIQFGCNHGVTSSLGMEIVSITVFSQEDVKSVRSHFTQLPIKIVNSSSEGIPKVCPIVTHQLSIEDAKELFNSVTLIYEIPNNKLKSIKNTANFIFPRGEYLQLTYN